MAMYRAGTKASKIASPELDNMFAMNVAKLDKMGWALSVVFAPKKNSTLRFCAENENFNVVRI